jgi:hypothetical protein
MFALLSKADIDCTSRGEVACSEYAGFDELAEAMPAFDIFQSEVAEYFAVLGLNSEGYSPP